jgi:hypothetical protein
MLTRDKEYESSCTEFQRILSDSYKERTQLIQECISVSQKKLENLSTVSPADRIENYAIKRELEVEEILRERTREVFERKCRGFKIQE